MNGQQQKEFLQATAWLRPWTRWATRFSILTSAALPSWISNLPLKVVKRILRHYQLRMTASCKSH